MLSQPRIPPVHRASQAEFLPHTGVFLVPVPLAQSEIDDVHVVNFLPHAEHEILGLDITVYDTFTSGFP